MEETNQPELNQDTNSLGELGLKELGTEEGEEDSTEPSPKDFNPDQEFFSCPRCGSMRLELLWFDKRTSAFHFRCLACGMIIEIKKDDFNFSKPLKKNKTKISNIGTYFG